MHEQTPAGRAEQEAVIGQGFIANEKIENGPVEQFSWVVPSMPPAWKRPPQAGRRAVETGSLHWSTCVWNLDAAPRWYRR